MTSEMEEIADKDGVERVFQKLLNKHYGIDAIESTPIGHYQSCKKDKQQFILVPVGQ